MDIEKVKELALINGFKLKEQASGNMDLNAYVYDFANAIEREAKAQAVPEGFVLVPKEPTDEIIEAMNEFDYRNDYSDMDGAYRTIVETLEKAQEDAEREQKG